MIKYVDDTVFNVNADCIVNTVNCVGVMGKGLALEFALRFPELNSLYIEDCKKNIVKPGNVYYYNIDGTKILNFTTKNHYKDPSRYEWIEEGLKAIVNLYKKLDINSIAVPYLGCSNGGLDKNKVLKLIEKYLDLNDLIVYVCSSKKVSGVEQNMIDSFKSTDLDRLSKIVKLNYRQLDRINENKKNINHFYDILKMPGIGIKTYKKLFDYFYNHSFNKKEAQTNIFDYL